MRTTIFASLLLLSGCKTLGVAVHFGPATGCNAPAYIACADPLPLPPESDGNTVFAIAKTNKLLQVQCITQHAEAVRCLADLKANKIIE